MDEQLKAYQKIVAKYGVLTREEERELVIKAQNGNSQAREKLLLHNQRIIIGRAGHWSVAFGSNTSLMMSLVSVGNIIFLEKLDSFDVETGNKLFTFMMPWIDHAMRRYTQDNTRVVRLPVHLQERLSKIDTLIAKCRVLGFVSDYKELFINESKRDADGNKYVRKVSLAEIRSKLGSRHKTPYSLDFAFSAPNGEDGETCCLHDLVKCKSADETVKTLEEFGSVREEEKVRYLSILVSEAELSDKERAVICLRFGIGRGKGVTLQKAGKELGLTRERVRQIQVRAMEKLRSAYERLNEHVSD